MNSLIKGALIFLGGVALGSGTSYLITKSVINEKYEKEISDRVQDEIAQYKAHQMSKLNADIKEEIKDKIIFNHEKDPITSADIENYKKELEKYSPKEISYGFSNVKEPTEEPDDEESVLEKHNAFEDSAKLSEDDILAEEEDEDTVVEKGENKAPYIISPEEFQYDHQDDYEKESLIFFKDNILTDEDYKEINNDDAIRILGGGKLFTAFGSKGAKSNVVYIRNELLHTDYEVFSSPRKYTTEVLHMEDEEDKE